MSQSQAFEVIGGKSLSGDLVPQGAKNEALQILSAVLLTTEVVEITNIPDIIDIRMLIELLRGLGVKVNQIGKGHYTFQADDVGIENFASENFQSNSRKIRGSVMLIGPLLARFKKAFLPKPGGDKIGRRRLDTHFNGFTDLGAKFVYDEKADQYYVEAKDGLHGAYVLMDEISVTGTANILMAAVLAEGKTTIYNAACEPYLQQLCRLLTSMGAKIEGQGSNLLIIHGVKKLGGAKHRILPDMIEIGSFIGLAAMTQSTIRIKDCHIPELGIIPRIFERLGIVINI
ncbi:MAG: UDP-N-acetylglucosamine 1-carboxyvinyltransferase, partial [Saprospiraceae bacterium]